MVVSQVMNFALQTTIWPKFIMNFNLSTGLCPTFNKKACLKLSLRFLVNILYLHESNHSCLFMFFRICFGICLGMGNHSHTWWRRSVSRGITFTAVLLKRPKAWGGEGQFSWPSSHAFWAEIAEDQALQCPEQELFHDPDSFVGQQWDWVHTVCGEYWTRMSGGRGSKARIARGEDNPGKDHLSFAIWHIFSSSSLSFGICLLESCYSWNSPDLISEWNFGKHILVT